jgi:hypothetical protein
MQAYGQIWSLIARRLQESNMVEKREAYHVPFSPILIPSEYINTCNRSKHYTQH